MERVLYIFWLCLLCVGCSPSGQTPPTEIVFETTVTEETTETTTIDEIASQIDEMSLEDKVGQMLIVDVGELDTDFVSGSFDAKVHNAGGYILFDDDIRGVADTQALTAKLRQISDIPPFIAVDEEGGAVSRIGRSGAVADYSVPSARSMAENGTVGENYAKIAKTLAAMGFNMDFAPDADVDTNPDNPIIGSRAFSTDAQTAGENVVIAINALRDNGVIPVVKHFPGHGDTATDSHVGTAVLRHDRQRLDSVELVPFKKAIENGAEVIMVGHIKVPALSDSDRPATLDPDIITGLLRGELGYDGVVVTDAMNMGAVTVYGMEDSIKYAVDAGADMLLMPPDTGKAYDALLAMAENGDISRDRIDESVYRILKLKKKLRRDNRRDNK